jgi:copper(I)-binding protein
MHSLTTATGVSVVSTVEQEARVDRFKLTACGLAVAIALAGCSAGQISQTATQQAAVNGTSANLGDIALRNVHLRANLTTDYVQPGREVELLFQVSNESPDTEDKLVSITSDVGAVSVTGDTTVPAGGVLVVGAPDGQTTPLDAVEAADAAQATLTLSKPITNGLTYNFTFKFEKAGEATVVVPISAGESLRREAAVEAGGGGH